jgi:predicted ferric reductase
MPSSAIAPERDGRASGEPEYLQGVPPRAHPYAVLAAIMVGALATIAVWWFQTPAFSGLGDWLTNAGRVTGLMAGYGIVVLIALMARLPPVERGVGADRLARWHSMGGRYLVGLVVTHALLITWGYAVTAHTGVVSEAGTLLLDYPDVLMATVAGLLLVGIGIVSARAARRRLRYETWYFLHFYTYLAVALAFSHQFANGAEFIASLPARVFWSALYIAVAAAIVWYRFVTPVRQAARHRLRVLAVQPEAPGVVSVVIGGEHLPELRAEPGQFFRWRFLTRGLWWVSSPYSLSAPPQSGRLRITVKGLGDHSAALARLRPGTTVVAEGPYGALTGATRVQRRVVLIAGGVGITPLRALFQSIPAGPGDLTLLYRASTDDDVVFRRELEQLAERRRARLFFIVGSRADLGADPLTAAALKANVPRLDLCDAYVCGPPGMTSAVIRELRAAGVRRRHIHHESFEF